MQKDNLVLKITNVQIDASVLKTEVFPLVHFMHSYINQELAIKNLSFNKTKFDHFSSQR